jgi:hypothetical protein
LTVTPLRDQRWRRIRHALLACAFVVGFEDIDTAHAQALGSDAAAKAKLVATLARFVQWPPASFETDTSPLRLCVFTASATVERAFQSQNNTPVGTRSVRTVINPQAVAKNCHILFVDENGGFHVDRMLRSLSAEPAFTVGTQDGFVSDGGMVEIVHVDNALRFDVNLVALREAGLSVNPGVLKLARQVRQ